MERQITDEGLLAIEVTRTLNNELGIPLSQAAAIARTAMRSRDAAEARFATASGVSLTLPLLAIERRLRERMLDAMEAVAHVRRGRPRGK